MVRGRVHREGPKGKLCRTVQETKIGTYFNESASLLLKDLVSSSDAKE